MKGQAILLGPFVGQADEPLFCWTPCPSRRREPSPPTGSQHAN